MDGTELLGTLEGRKGEKINTGCCRDGGAAEERFWDLAENAPYPDWGFPSLYGYEQGKLQHLGSKNQKPKTKWCAELEVTSQDGKEVPGRHKKMEQ